MTIQNVTCEFTSSPIAVDCKHPRFSWEIDTEENNVFQASWQIVVKNEYGSLMWDSGIRKSSESVGIPYEGKELTSSTIYKYRISIQTNTGAKVESREYTFETAFFHLLDWNACWIEPNPLPQLPINPLVTAKKYGMNQLMPS